jgi:hypothetical protein
MGGREEKSHFRKMEPDQINQVIPHTRLKALQGVSYVRARYCNLRFSELVQDIKVSFGYDVPILVDFTYAKNEPSEHEGSGEMGIGQRKLCQNQDLQKKLQIISRFKHNIALMHFSLQFVNVHLTYISLHIL